MSDEDFSKLATQSRLDIDKLIKEFNLDIIFLWFILITLFILKVMCH